MSPEEREHRKDALNKSKDLDNKMNKEHAQDEQVNKLLLLGAGESGKSTLFKQMIQIYGKGFPVEERKTYISVIYNNIVASMKTLVQQSKLYGSIGSDCDASARYVDQELKGDEEIDERVGQHLKLLWRDKGIQATYEQRSKYQLTDGAGYFFDRLDDVMRRNYIPSEQDIFRCRVRTTGIVENDFTIDGNSFKMIDVGGQRNERKKWIHCFEGVTAVLFVAAISEYDQVLYEDEKKNRLTEALEVFENICNQKYFKDTVFILFLNKMDLFADKLKRKISIKTCFPEYSGDEYDFDQTTAFMTGKFQAANKTKTRTIFVHLTCATDTKNVERVFEAAKKAILEKNVRELQGSGVDDGISMV
jgi:GTPase SAR1 family protein